MKKLIFALFVTLFFVGCNKPTPPTVEWIELGKNPETGLNEHEIVVRGLPTDSNDWIIWFWAKAFTKYEALEKDGMTLEHYKARVYMLRPEGVSSVAGVARLRFATALKYANTWKFPNRFSFRNGTDKPVKMDITYKLQPLKSDGEEVYNTNAAVTISESAPEHIVPCPKHIIYGEEDTTDLSAWSRATADVKMINEKHPEGWYRITLDGDIKIEAADEFGAYYAATTLENIKTNGTIVRNMTIEDYPDFDIRGFMLNVATTHKTMDEVYRLVDFMARYKLNLLHMHLTDDYGWRIEIPEIPELNEVGARSLIPQPDGKGGYKVEGANISTTTFDKNDMSYANNRNYSREDYINLIKYAAERKIRILPEIDFPGHSLATVESLLAYERRTGDKRYSPIHPEDKSEYKSVQDVGQNTFDVGLESTYNFMALVFDNLIAMHNEAGVPLTEIHIGGDEVPEGAWYGSPACQNIIKNAKSIEEKKIALYSHFANRVMDIAEARNIKICGWHEIVEHLDEPTWKRMAAHCAWINFWETDKLLPIAQKAVENGVNVVMSNGQYTYLEEAYTFNRQETGNVWAGVIDIKTAFSYDPYNPAYPMKNKQHIIGVQSQLWWSQLDLLVFPKGLGNFDRMWNSAPVCSYDHYYSTLVNNELPYLSSKGVQYHIPQAGLKIEDGKLVANAPFCGGEIRYNFGEETPTKESTLWSEPVAIPEDVKVISARYFYDGRESVTTTLRR